MMITDADIANMDRIERLNLINSLSGVKPAHLIGTISKTGNTNLAIFNSVVHIGSSPALLGFILRPDQGFRRDTLENILDTGFYTINHVHQSFVAKAHYTSAKFEAGQSEFDACQLSPQFLEGFEAPFVQESEIKIGMQFVQKVSIEINSTSLIIGKIKLLEITSKIQSEHGHLDLSTVENVGVSGLNTYYAINKIARFPYARPQELPDYE